MAEVWRAFVKEDYIVEPKGAGRLQGLTFAVKDVFAIKGIANTAGNPDWLRTHGPSDRNAAVIDMLLAQGARLKGITHTDELMFSLNGENHHYGTPVNPKAPGRIPGGSSSGSAVAAAAGAANFALGTDTGGSVRIPSAYCGIYGFRPTYGLVPVDGVIPLSASFDTVGWMAKDPAVLAVVGRTLLPGLEPNANDFTRLYVSKEAWDVADEEAKAALAKLMPVIEARFTRSEWSEIAPEGLPSWVDTFRTIQGYEIWSAHGEWIEREKPYFGPGIAERFAWTRTIQREQFERQLVVRGQIRSRMEELLGDDGIVVIPTVPCVAPKTGMAGAEIESIRARTMQLSCIAGLGGLPQVTIPAIAVSGMPVGLSLVAGPRQDIRLLALVQQIVKSLAVDEQAV